MRKPVTIVDTFQYVATPLGSNPASPVAGQTLQYDLFLVDTNSGTLLAPAREDGLFGAGVKVTPTVSNGPSTITSITGDTVDFGPGGLLTSGPIGTGRATAYPSRCQFRGRPAAFFKATPLEGR